ncbi:MAG: hypothetical protein J0H04_05145 [Hyphomicrobium denitrificans]|nr:hypothetical protein [Hyphomicrobium denitrificans]
MPDFEQTVPLVEVLLYGILNPATIVVAFMLGQKANEKSKLLIAAFAGAIAGVAVAKATSGANSATASESTNCFFRFFDSTSISSLRAFFLLACAGPRLP